MNNFKLQKLEFKQLIDDMTWILIFDHLEILQAWRNDEVM